MIRVVCFLQMRASKFSSLCRGLILFLPLSSLSLSAQVTYYGVEKNQFYSQTENNTAPSGPYEYSVYSFVDTAAPGQASDVTVTDGETVTNLIGTSTAFGGSDYYSTKSTMDAAFPSGSNATFAVSGGSLGSETQSIPTRTDDYPQEMYVTDTAITDAQNLNPATGYTFNIGYTGTGTSTSTALAILGPSGTFVYDVNGAADQSSYSVSSSILESLTPGEEYTVEIVDFNDVDAPATGGFNGAANAEAFTDTTLFSISTVSTTTVPEPSTWIMVLFALGIPLYIKARGLRIGARVVTRAFKILP
jgi:hypothetical protein